jgi:hypothetical protein
VLLPAACCCCGMWGAVQPHILALVKLATAGSMSLDSRFIYPATSRPLVRSNACKLAVVLLACVLSIAQQTSQCMHAAPLILIVRMSCNMAGLPWQAACVLVDLLRFILHVGPAASSAACVWQAVLPCISCSVLGHCRGLCTIAVLCRFLLAQAEAGIVLAAGCISV